MRTKKVILYVRDMPIDAVTENNAHGNNIWTQLTGANIGAYYHMITCNKQYLLPRCWLRLGLPD